MLFFFYFVIVDVSMFLSALWTFNANSYYIRYKYFKLWILIENKFFLFVLVVFFVTVLVWDPVWLRTHMYCVCSQIKWAKWDSRKKRRRRRRITWSARKKRFTTKTVQCIGCFAFGIADKMRYLLKLVSYSKRMIENAYIHTHRSHCN